MQANIIFILEGSSKKYMTVRCKRGVVVVTRFIQEFLLQEPAFCLNLKMY